MAGNENQTRATVEAGTRGRLLRVCMDAVRDDPTWEAVGPIREAKGTDGKTVYRQVIKRPDPRSAGFPR